MNTDEIAEPTDGASLWRGQEVRVRAGAGTWATAPSRPDR